MTRDARPDRHARLAETVVLAVLLGVGLGLAIAAALLLALLP